MAKSIQVDTKTFIRFWLVVAVLGVLTFLLIKAKTALLIILVAMFLAIAITPLMKKIDRVINRKKSRPGLAAGITVGGLVLIFGVVLAAAGPVIVKQTSEFMSTAPEQLQNSLSQLSYINTIGERFGIQDAQSQIVSFAKNGLHNILGAVPQALFDSVGAVIGTFTATILTIVLTLLFMTQGPKVLSGILRRFDEKHGEATKLAKEIIGKISKVISSYVTGQLFVALIDGIMVSLAVFLLSLIFGFASDLAIPMGLLAIIFYMIPMFGPVITCVIVTLLLLFSCPWAGLTFLIFYAIFEQIQANVVSPKIQGRNMTLPPLIVLIAVTLGIYTFGIIGAIVSIPIAGIIKVLIDEYPRMKKLAQG